MYAFFFLSLFLFVVIVSATWVIPLSPLLVVPRYKLDFLLVGYSRLHHDSRNCVVTTR